MTMTTSTTLLQRLSSLINETEIDRLARERGIIQRQRKINLTSLIWTLVIASGGRKVKTQFSIKSIYCHIFISSLALKSHLRCIL